MAKIYNMLMVFAMMLIAASPMLVSAQYGYGSGSSGYPDCATCPSGTYVSNNAPTYWNCYGSGALCSYTGVSTTSSVSTSIATTQPTTSINNTSGGLNSNSTNQTAVTTVATTVPTTTVPSVTGGGIQAPNCNACPSGTYASNNAPTYWNCYGTGSLCTYTGTYTGGSYGSLGTYAYGLMGVIAVIAIILLAMMKAMPTRLTIIGVALILIGTVAWLYGDYAAGPNYIIAGAIAVVVGWLIWLYADVKLLSDKNVGKMIVAGVVLSLIGTAIWLYGDFYLGISPTLIWGGVALIVIGTLVWLLGDSKAGSFIMGKPKAK
ncbi:MAG: hypothetical protein KGH54_04200 [Candidatus Micrarchaeota archaeon]|nr:hypothetical protein [Candidatus Micrarchaeota archaeon]